MPKPVIYISSTFFDLEEHRKALIDALRKTERFDVVCMENYGTRSTPPLDKCLADVELAEFYILLLGNRYGYIPPGREYSITNLEYKKAIGDADNHVVASKPDTNKCVLPFILKDNFTFSDEIVARIKKEETEDGEPASRSKREKLDTLKKAINRDFTLDKGFSTPDDLTTKVFGALIPELIDRNYAEVVNKLKLSEALAYRCNREGIRNDFLEQNFYNRNFYRVYIIHGEKSDLPVIFSNNISTYELSVPESFAAYNLDEYDSNYPDKFLIKLTRDLYYNVFRSWPENPALTLNDLAQKVIADDRFANVVFIFDMYYASWKEKYKKSLALFFAKLNEVNATLKSSKNFYLLMNIKFLSPKEKLKELPPSATTLDRLTKISISHIEQWVKTYFFLSTRKNESYNNRSLMMAQKISDYYFLDDASKEKTFSMQDAIDKLESIIQDFNSNRNLFANYNKLFNNE